MTFDGEALRLLDQRALPGEVRYEICRTAEETAEAIKTLVVRGAPAIGVAAAFGVALAAKRAAEEGDSLDAALSAAHQVLAASRPTAVNLFWALDQMRRVQATVQGAEADEVAATVVRAVTAGGNSVTGGGGGGVRRVPVIQYAPTAPPSMPQQAPSMKPARRPCRRMNSDAGSVLAADPRT